MIKITFGIIVLNGDFVLEEALRSIYPYAHQILVAEGPVRYWQDKGFLTSTDRTNEILDNFPDPEGKITVVHGQFSEKDEQCNAYMKYLSPEADYIWNLDSDEIFKPEDIEKIMDLLEKEKYTSVGFKSISFYGGFENYLSGFEEKAEFFRIRKVYPGSYWMKHRPPKITHVFEGEKLPEKHLNFEECYQKHGIRMYHYSYVFPRQVHQKIEYYKHAVSTSNIENYFNRVYLPWVTGNEDRRISIENEFNGVHEYNPAYRGACRTTKFLGEHPQVIQESLEKLKAQFHSELKSFLS